MTNLVTTRDGDKFTLFFSIRSPFSNFHPCEFVLLVNDVHGKVEKKTFHSTEQYYMYHKAVFFKDEEIAESVMRLSDVKKIKALSHFVKNFDIHKWDEQSKGVMFRGNMAKYRQNEELRRQLFYTHGSVLVECSPNDRVWGIGLDMSNPDAVNPKRWRGENRLGQMLTGIRDELWLLPEYAAEVASTLKMLTDFDIFAGNFFKSDFVNERLDSSSFSPSTPTRPIGENALVKLLSSAPPPVYGNSASRYRSLNSQSYSEPRKRTYLTSNNNGFSGEPPSKRKQDRSRSSSRSSSRERLHRYENHQSRPNNVADGAYGGGLPTVVRYDQRASFGAEMAAAQMSFDGIVCSKKLGDDHQWTGGGNQAEKSDNLRNDGGLAEKKKRKSRHSHSEHGRHHKRHHSHRRHRKSGHHRKRDSSSSDDGRRKEKRRRRGRSRSSSSSWSSQTTDSADDRRKERKEKRRESRGSRKHHSRERKDVERIVDSYGESSSADGESTTNGKEELRDVADSFISLLSRLKTKSCGAWEKKARHDDRTAIESEPPLGTSAQPANWNATSANV